MDIVSQIIAYESGEMTDAEILRFFSDLVKSGQVNHLQGSYGRTAAGLIRNGYLDGRGNITAKGQAILEQ